MLIKYKFHNLNDDNKFQGLENGPLNDEDLKNSKFLDLEGQSHSLLNYVGK